MGKGQQEPHCFYTICSRLSVGRYVSPAVYSYRERIQIYKNMNDIEYITKDGLAKL